MPYLQMAVIYPGNMRQLVMIRRTYLSLMILSLAAAFLAVSCASFPEPRNDTDTLLILRTEFDKSVVADPFGYYRITISTLPGKVVRRINIKQYFDKTHLITGLAPGKYKVSKVEFVYNSGNVHEETITIYHYPFTLRPGAMTLVNWKFVFRFYRRPPSDKLWMNKRWVQMGFEEKAGLLNELKTEESFSLWDTPRWFKRASE